MSERFSDAYVAMFATNYDKAAAIFPSEVQALAREVQERRKDDWANDLADLKLSADMLAVRDLCARHGITVEGIVALVDEAFNERNDSDSEWSCETCGGSGFVKKRILRGTVDDWPCPSCGGEK